MNGGHTMADVREIQRSWDEFVKEYNYIMKFGVQALQERLNQRAAAQGQTYRLKDNDVADIMLDLQGQLGNALDKSLKLVNDELKQRQTPRGDFRPEIEEGLVAKRTRQFEAAPWAEKFDFAADTRVQDSFDDFKNLVDAQNQADPDRRNELVNQYKLKLQMDMSKRLENKLKMDYVPKMKPRAPGQTTP